MKGPGRVAEAWHCERPGEAIGEGAASVSVSRRPRIEGVMQAEKLKPGTMKRAYERLLVKPSCSVLEIPVP